MDSFLLITTGGTIDSIAYNETPDNIIPLNSSMVPMALQAMGVSDNQYRHHAMPPADSKLFLTDDQHERALRQHLALELPEFPKRRVRVEDLIDFIHKQPEKNILITHGTDALARNANTIWQGLSNISSNKIVIFVSAMIPLANSLQKDGSYNFKLSDGYANLSRAIAEFASGKLVRGVYIAANWGKFFVGNEQLAQVVKEYNTPTPQERYFYLRNSI